MNLISLKKIKFDFLGTITGILGAIIVASNINLNFYGFFLFLLSSIFYIIYSIETNQKNLLVLNIVFTIIDIIGMIRYY
jgi:hypothetical protein